MLAVSLSTHAVGLGVGVRCGILVIVHIVCRGRRWCRARRETFRAVDVPLLWADAALTVLSRTTLAPGDVRAVLADVVLAAVAHDVLVHSPAVFFVHAMERRRWGVAACLCAATLVSRATLSLFYGHAYTALALLSLRHAWLGLGVLSPSHTRAASSRKYTSRIV